MSAKQAAAALLKHDVELYAFSLRKPDCYSMEWGQEVRDFLGDYVLGTWTLTLAAEAANAEEVQVLAALFYALGTGSTAVARGNAERLMRGEK